MSRQVIFVLSDMRSGSTLLDQLLGAHPAIVSVGEIHWLPAYVNQDRRIYDPDHELVCTCGHTLQNCEFWRQVGVALGRPLGSLQLRPAKSGLAMRMLHRFPRAFRNGLVQKALVGSQLHKDSLALFDAIFSVSGRPFIVDSSKSPFRFRSIYDAKPEDTRAIVLVRDYRAVVHSKMKRGHSLDAAATGWRTRMTEIEALTGDLPAERILTLTYERLCGDPPAELRGICDFLGQPFSPLMLERPRENIHHIGGSPSKFDPSRSAIALDTTYVTAFSSAELSRLRALVGPVAERWGY